MNNLVDLYLGCKRIHFLHGEPVELNITECWLDPNGIVHTFSAEGMIVPVVNVRFIEDVVSEPEPSQIIFDFEDGNGPIPAQVY